MMSLVQGRREKIWAQGQNYTENVAGGENYTAEEISEKHKFFQ